MSHSRVCGMNKTSLLHYLIRTIRRQQSSETGCSNFKMLSEALPIIVEIDTCLIAREGTACTALEYRSEHE